MDKIIVGEKISCDSRYNAGSKAREDIEKVFLDAGYKLFSPVIETSEKRKSSNKLSKLFQHYDCYKQWISQLCNINNSSIVVFQFPVRPHTLLLSRVLKYLKRKNCYTVAVIHDLESLRLANSKDNTTSQSKRLIIEEKTALPEFDLVVAHNSRMKSFLVRSLKINEEKIENIEIFDYLLNDFSPKNIGIIDNYSVVIAGNLAREKAGYLYHIPSNLHIELFGSNYEEQKSETIHYNGAFLPDDLPNELKGSFGLIWDGSSTDTCTGTYGEYLKYNNPHKASLYLACEIPIIAWKASAIAKFVEEKKCGLAVDSIDEIPSVLSKLSGGDYDELKNNAAKVGAYLRKGSQTKRIINIIDKRREV